MEYIISKGEKLPTSVAEMENQDWFNMYKTKKMPYNELLVGDILYWLDHKPQNLIWKTKVVRIYRKYYQDKNIFWNKYGKSMKSKYFDKIGDIGYFLKYEIKVIEELYVPKPNDYTLDRLGWDRLDEQKFQKWFHYDKLIEDNPIIDENFDFDNTLAIDKLLILNERIKDLPFDRISKLVSVTIRKDTTFIKTLKEAAGFKCQFPGCGHQIRTEKGTFYIEVAHIKAFKNNGKSKLGNLLVLCPNHHKEFDYGKLKIKNQTVTEISGTLNEKEFEINLNF